MKFFVAGATGYTGARLVRALRRAGCEVVAHVRPDSRERDARTQEWIGLGAQVDTTPWGSDWAAVFRARGVTHVFALLGTTRARGKRAAAAGREETYETVDYGLTMELLRGAEALVDAPDGAPKFIYLSSLGADAPRGNAYLSVRARVEAALRASRLRFVIARPSFITGADREEARAGERVAAAALDAGLGVLGALGNAGVRAAGSFADRYRSMSGGELAEALRKAAEDPAAEGQVLDAAALRARYLTAAP